MATNPSLSEIDELVNEKFGFPKDHQHRIRKDQTTQSVFTPLSLDDIFIPSSSENGVLYDLKGELLSSFRGKIKALLLAYPYYDGRFDLLRDTVLGIVNTLDEDVTLYLYGDFPLLLFDMDAQEQGSLQIVKDIRAIRIAHSGNTYLLKANNNTRYTNWVRDPFVVAQLPGSAASVVLVEPYTFSRLEANTPITVFGSTLEVDVSIADQIAERSMNGKTGSLDIAQIRTTLSFHGGNVLVGDEHIFIGADYFDVVKQVVAEVQKRAPEENLFVPYGVTDPSTLEANELTQTVFQHHFSPVQQKTVVKIGAPRPATLAQNNVVRPYRGNEYLNKWLFIDGVEQPFFHLDLFITLIGPDPASGRQQVLLPQLVNASGVHMPALYYELIFPWNQWLGSIATQLITLDYEVHYLPAPITYFQGVGNYRYWCLFTYHNSLVEVTERNRRIWLPKFGDSTYVNEGILRDQELTRWNNVAKQTIHQLGLDIVPIGDYTSWMVKAGGLHCLTHELRRHDEPVPIGS